MRRRRGYTLVEIALAVGLVSVLLYGLVALLTSGSRLFSRGVGAARGPEWALIIMGEIERDLMQCLQLPGDPRPPLNIHDDGSLSFYMADDQSDLTQLAITAAPVRWHLVPAEETGRFYPARNDKVFRTMTVKGWDFRLLEPDEAEARHGWYVVAQITFEKDNRVDKDFLSSNLIYLAQPSTNFLHFPSGGAGLRMDRVLFRPHPEGAEAGYFRGLGPPEVQG